MIEIIYCMTISVFLVLMCTKRRNENLEDSERYNDYEEYDTPQYYYMNDRRRHRKESEQRLRHLQQKREVKVPEDRKKGKNAAKAKASTGFSYYYNLTKKANFVTSVSQYNIKVKGKFPKLKKNLEEKKVKALPEMATDDKENAPEKVDDGVGKVVPKGIRSNFAKQANVSEDEEEDAVLSIKSKLLSKMAFKYISKNLKSKFTNQVKLQNSILQSKLQSKLPSKFQSKFQNEFRVNLIKSKLRSKFQSKVLKSNI